MKKINILILFTLLFLSLSTVNAQKVEIIQPIQKLFSAIENGGSNLYGDFDCFKAEGIELLSVDEKCIQSYMQILKNTGVFSNQFISNQQKMYADLQVGIEKKQQVYIPWESDRYLGGQDPLPIGQMNEILKDAIPKSNGMKASVPLKIQGFLLITYHLIKEDGVWKINEIEE